MDCAAHLLVLVVEKLRLDQVRGKAIEARISSRVWLDVIFAQGSVDLLELLDEFILLGLIVGYGWLRRVGGWGSGLFSSVLPGREVNTCFFFFFYTPHFFFKPGER